jgi:uncharacterized phage-associated protein
VGKLARTLSKQIDAEIFAKKYAPVKEVLTIVGAGAFLVASVAIPNLPRGLKPFLKDEDERDAYKRFNIRHLKQTLERLEKQKLVERSFENGEWIIKITRKGRQKILRYALDELEIEKPPYWDRKWYLVVFDIPEDYKARRDTFTQYLKAWGFYPFQKSVYLHAYSTCLEPIEFLREHLGVGKYVRILTVSKIENDREFRGFFGV